MRRASRGRSRSSCAKGDATKSFDNLVVGATYAVVAEALTVGKRHGIDPETMTDVMNASNGGSFDSLGVAGDHSEPDEHRPKDRLDAGAEG